MFGEFGSVDFEVTDFRSGHSRVFVKFRQRSSALAALSSLRSTFKDLGIAKNCAVDNENKVVLWIRIIPKFSDPGCKLTQS